MSGVRAKREKRPLLRRRRCVLRPLARVGRRRVPAIRYGWTNGPVYC